MSGSPRRAHGALLPVVLLALLACGDGGTTTPGEPDPESPQEGGDYSPTSNTTLSGTVSFESVTIPAGVTVTATADLVLNVTGDVAIAGALAGDCVALTLNGGAAVSITGRVANACGSLPPGADAPALRLVSSGAMTLDGAELRSSGDATLATDPALDLDDFPGAARTDGRTLTLASASLRMSPGAAAAGAGGATGEDGRDGSAWLLMSADDLVLRGSTHIVAQDGGAGGAASVTTDAAGASAASGNGGDGGRVVLAAAGALDVGGWSAATASSAPSAAARAAGAAGPPDADGPGLFPGWGGAGGDLEITVTSDAQPGEEDAGVVSGRVGVGGRGAFFQVSAAELIGTPPATSAFGRPGAPGSASITAAGGADGTADSPAASGRTVCVGPTRPVETWNFTDLVPRLGLSYALGEEGQTLLKTSYAQYADQLDLGTIGALDGVPTLCDQPPVGPGRVTVTATGGLEEAAKLLFGETSVAVPPPIQLDVNIGPGGNGTDAAHPDGGDAGTFWISVPVAPEVVLEDGAGSMETLVPATPVLELSGGIAGGGSGAGFDCGLGTPGGAGGDGATVNSVIGDEFWFFEPDNLDLIVQILDGPDVAGSGAGGRGAPGGVPGAPGSFWVFFTTGESRPLDLPGVTGPAGGGCTPTRVGFPPRFLDVDGVIPLGDYDLESDDAAHSVPATLSGSDDIFQFFSPDGPEVFLPDGAVWEMFWGAGDPAITPTRACISALGDPATRITVETLDEAGNVVRTDEIGGLRTDRFQDACIDLKLDPARRFSNRWLINGASAFSNELWIEHFP